jgi:hypothetical protein
MSSSPSSSWLSSLLSCTACPSTASRPGGQLVHAAQLMWRTTLTAVMAAASRFSYRAREVPGSIPGAALLAFSQRATPLRFGLRLRAGDPLGSSFVLGASAALRPRRPAAPAPQALRFGCELQSLLALLKRASISPARGAAVVPAWSGMILALSASGPGPTSQSSPSSLYLSRLPLSPATRPTPHPTTARTRAQTLPHRMCIWPAPADMIRCALNGFKIARAQQIGPRAGMAADIAARFSA